MCMCVCHLANHLISSYYSNMPGPAATVNNTVRRYESLIKMDVTHSNKADNSNQNSIQISYLNSQTTLAHTHTHTRLKYSAKSHSRVYNDDYKNTPWYARNFDMEMQTHTVGNEDTSSREACTHTHIITR